MLGLVDDALVFEMCRAMWLKLVDLLLSKSLVLELFNLNPFHGLQLQFLAFLSSPLHLLSL